MLLAANNRGKTLWLENKDFSITQQDQEDFQELHNVRTWKGISNILLVPWHCHGMATAAPTTFTLQDNIQDRKQGDEGVREKYKAFFAWMVSYQEGQTFPGLLTAY